MSYEKDLINRISFYLASGGLFNPELADHIAVRTLLFECREALAQQDSKDKEQAKTDSFVRQLDEALAQPEQEPLEYWNAVEGWVKIDEVREHFDSVGCGTIYKTAGEDRTPLYTSPPQRKPLTDEEICEALSGIDCTRPMLIARAIEAAHGIKGEA